MYDYRQKQEHAMSYVVYEVESTRIVSEKRYGKTHFATEGAAKAARTRLIKKGKYNEDQLKVQDAQAYRMFIETTVERVNLMSGKTYRESVNTPNCCSPASETYWSM
jgi:hypothetical protein